MWAVTFAFLIFCSDFFHALRVSGLLPSCKIITYLHLNLELAHKLGSAELSVARDIGLKFL